MDRVISGTWSDQIEIDPGAENNLTTASRNKGFGVTQLGRADVFFSRQHGIVVVILDIPASGLCRFNQELDEPDPVYIFQIQQIPGFE